MEEHRYISIPEMAKLLGLSRIAVYNKVKAGKIKAVKIGRNYAIPEKYIQEILGKELSDAKKEKIKHVVKRTVQEYGDVLKRLGKE